MAAAPQVLRYPYDMLTESTDYLQIDLISKSFAGKKTTKIGNTDVTTLIRPPKAQRDDKTGQIGGFAKTGKGQDVSNVNKLSENFVTKNNGIILLPIPSNISDSNSINFSEDKLDAATAAAAGYAYDIMTTSGTDFKEILTEIGKKTTSALQGLQSNSSDIKKIVLGNLAAQAAGIAGVGNVSLDQILARSEGKILNPNMELLFNGPTIRSFKFSFKMTPRGPEEAKQCKLIIGSLKRHMTPKPAGVFLGTPDFFELRYRQGSLEHPFLHKFKQCVLTDMSVNYTGENTYATYDDGTPVSMIMDLTFKELEPIYSKDYSDKDPGVGY